MRHPNVATSSDCHVPMLRRTKVRALAALTVALCLAAGWAHAACTSPAGNEAAIIYNGDYHTYQFCNGSSWIAYGGAAGVGPMVLISTQTASSSASLQFTNLPTTYNTLFLDCEGLLTSADQDGISGVIGEGAGPTWETTANYTLAEFQYWNCCTQNDYSTSAASLFNVCNSNTIPSQMKVYIDSPGSSSQYKIASFQTSCWWSGSPAEFIFMGSGYWTSDTNPITGIKLTPNSGTITSGTCSLYGMQ
jgi:hypothetical protein